MKLSDKILKLRKSNGMSQEELAEKLNVSRQTISRWEMDSAKPDANNLLQISKLFGVTTDYLLNDNDDLPKLKKDSKILHTNLTLIAIIAQVSFLNATIRPFQTTNDQTLKFMELMIKFIPLLTSSIWMAHNLRYEKNPTQYKKNVKIELVYCLIQASVALFGYYSKNYLFTTLLLITIALFYIFRINPKYMNRRLTRK